ncbi:E3 SUMO-protein ligase SIZ1-like isoform X1 [Salvia splendens]|uniref:E3 SUMO-protein ligase SIZ1-like isoform X1 n=1 Tax=Salvia splendens TaxID=180675 RepID=UPI001C2769BF|nr:E3 SUMO-protein ligase SIZ1-like isoform X1 [Salvia splendens]XP_042024388.1 E3 SUMO-protein ligase SIZ1-like isoform X1 [Salvia splendens]XP_042024391.1 E3 SUMO-protein ligase SIZ1-like isoform X1 [Salvia splendens]XP_042024392.1 E3 SUMO-protein ligase SIZ1-like isoform X1 [Salvia splendens]
MKVAGKFKLHAHMGCFDRGNEPAVKEVAMSYMFEELFFGENHHRCHAYFNRITSKVFSWIVMRSIFFLLNFPELQMKNCGEDVAEIEVKPDGSWCVKAEQRVTARVLGSLACGIHLTELSVHPLRQKMDHKPVKPDVVASDSNAGL